MDECMYVCMYVCLYVCLNACIFGPSSNVNSSMTTPTSHVNSSTTRPFSHVRPPNYPKDRRQNRQERHQSYISQGRSQSLQERRQSFSIPKTGGKTIRKDIRVIPRQESKTPGETSELRQDKRGRHQEQHEEHKHQSIKIITKGLVVALQPGRRQKQDQEHKHQIIKIVSCCFMPY